MKKKLTAAAALLACVFAFAACSSRVTVALNRNWQTNAGGGYETFYERLTYDVRFEAPDSSLPNAPSYANVSGTYTVTTESVASYRSESGFTANNVYRLTSVLEVSASILQNGELVYAFGGDTGAPADTITTSVWFRDALDGMTPLESTTTTYSHTPRKNGSIVIYSYTTKTVYNEDASRATVTVTDNSDSIAETLPEENSRVFVGTFNAGETSYSDLTDRYSVFDTAQLIFSARGLAFEADSSNTVTVVSGAAGGQYVTLSCSEVVARNYSFTMDGQPLPDTGTGSGSEEGTDGEEGSEGEEETGTSISTCVVNFAVSGPNNGQTHTVDYAARSMNASNNRYRNLPMRIEMNLAYGMGASLFVWRDRSPPPLPGKKKTTNNPLGGQKNCAADFLLCFSAL